MRNNNMTFLKMVSLVVIISFLWTNMVWAGGMEVYTLSSPSLMPKFEQADIEMLAIIGETTMSRLGIKCFENVAKSIRQLNELGVIGFADTDDQGRTARYVVVEEGTAIVRITKTGEIVEDLSYQLLQSIGIDSRIETSGGEIRECVRVTESNERFINIVLGLVSSGDPRWTVKAAKVSKPTNHRKKQLGELSVFSRLHFLIALVVLICSLLFPVPIVVKNTFAHKPATVDKCLEEAKDGNFPFSYYTYRCIGLFRDLGDEEIEGKLIVLLGNERWIVRSSAAAVLGELGNKIAVDPLIRLLDDPEYNVRIEAIVALGKLGATKVLLKMYVERIKKGKEDFLTRLIYDVLKSHSKVDLYLYLANNLSGQDAVDYINRLRELEDKMNTMQYLKYLLLSNTYLRRAIACFIFMLSSLVLWNVFSPRTYFKWNIKIRYMLKKILSSVFNIIKKTPAFVLTGIIEWFKNNIIYLILLILWTGFWGGCTACVNEFGQAAYHDHSFSFFIYFLLPIGLIIGAIFFSKTKDRGGFRLTPSIMFILYLIEAIFKWPVEILYGRLILNRQMIFVFHSTFKTILLCTTILVIFVPLLFFLLFVFFNPVLLKIGFIAQKPLTELLKDKNVYVRGEAIRVLGNLGDKRAIDPLLKLLGDWNGDIRRTAREALNKLGVTNEQLVDGYTSALESGNPYICEEAAEELGNLGDKRAIEPLLKLIGDGNPGVRRAVAGTLGRIGDVCATNPLLNLLGDWNGDIRRTAREALNKLGVTNEQLVDGYTSALESGDAGARKEAAEELGNFGDKRSINPLLARIKKGDTFVCPMLERLGVARNQIVDSCLEVLETGFYCVEMSRELGRLGDRRAIPVLIDKIGKDNSGINRKAYADALGELGDNSALGALLLCLRNGDAFVCPALEKLGFARDLIVDYCLNLMDRRCNCGEIAIELGRLGDERAIPVIRERLRELIYNGNDASAVEACRRALRSMGLDDIVEDYLDDLQSHRRDTVLKAEWSIHRLGYRIENTKPSSDVAFFIAKRSDISTEQVDTGQYEVVVVRQECFQDSGGSTGVVDISEERKITETVETFLGVRDVYIYPDTKQNKSSVLSTTLEGSETIIFKTPVTHQGNFEEVQYAGDLSKLADILGVSIGEAADRTKEILQGVFDELKGDEHYGIGLFGAAREVVLVDNLGGIDSNVRDEKGPLARFQNGTIAIDIDAFRSNLVLRSVVKHELRHSVLETVEEDKGIEEAAAIYGDLKDFTSMQEKDQDDLIVFLKRTDNGLDSANYAALLERVKQEALVGEQLITVAISYILSEPRYADIRSGLFVGMDDEVKTTLEKLNLAVAIYERIITAVSEVKAVEDVKMASGAMENTLASRMAARRLSITVAEKGILGESL